MELARTCRRILLSDAFEAVNAWYTSLNSYLQAAFWPALLWAAGLSERRLPLAGRAALAGALGHAEDRQRRAAQVGNGSQASLPCFGFLGRTRRPLRAWLRRHRSYLLEQNFTGRDAGKGARTLLRPGQRAGIAAFGRKLARPARAALDQRRRRQWQECAGLSRAASGDRRPKGRAVADPDRRELDRQHRRPRRAAPAGQRSTANRRHGRQPRCGRSLCLLFDSLSERCIKDAEDQVGAAVRVRRVQACRCHFAAATSPRRPHGKTFRKSRRGR